MSDTATAFVPGHITGFFSAHERADPVAAGSRGAGVALADGVRASVSADAETTLRLNGDPVDVEPVQRVLHKLGVEGVVEFETELPVGAGFGVSGAMALGTALAANAAFDLARTENELVRVAHVAEVESGTGLGDVVAQARGGVPIRVEPGAPECGELDGVPETGRIEYLALGERSTADVLAGDTTALSAAGETALANLRAEPTLGEFLAQSRRFAADAGLMSEAVRTVVDASESPASMAMLGETAFALGTGLSDAGYDAERCAIHPAGATMETDI